MKPLNNAERKKYRLKFIGMYIISIVLIAVILSGFLQPVPATKNIIIEKEKPARVITKTVYVMQKTANQNYLKESDSLKTLVVFNQKKIDELNAHIDSQKNIITQLQNQSQSAKNEKPGVNAYADKAKVAKLNKQIKFLDWALRSQVAVTNTLTKENNNLKAKIDKLNNK